MYTSILPISISFLTLIAAGQAVVEWGQCGGTSYIGPTACDCPNVCAIINPYYFECLASPVQVAGTTTVTYPVATSTCTPTASTSATTRSTTRSTTSRTTTSVAAPTSTCIQADPVGPHSDENGACSRPEVTNPYSGNVNIFLNPYYTNEVIAAVAWIKPTSATLAAKAQEVARIPNFIWLDTSDKVSKLASWVADAWANQAGSGTTLFQVVLYNIPNRDCHNQASTGEFSAANNGGTHYKGFIDSVASIVTHYPGFRFVVIVEPNALANLITNSDDPHCSSVQLLHKNCISYALQKLNQCNVWLYLDAGHTGWLGWPDIIGPASTLFSQIYNSVRPNRVRGLATNVGNYNALSAATPDPITQGNPFYDELHYINALVPLLIEKGFPARFITDQSRAGRLSIRNSWSDWCNIRGAGFGLRPGYTPLSCWIDQIVWAKPGGESDGTSLSSSPLYDSTCGLSDAKLPAPDAGYWFEAYFEDLLTYANPPL